jgi:hypothetical protein
MPGKSREKEKKSKKEGGERTAAQLPEHLDKQRKYVVCGPDKNYHVSSRLRAERKSVKGLVAAATAAPAASATAAAAFAAPLPADPPRTTPGAASRPVNAPPDTFALALYCRSGHGKHCRPTAVAHTPSPTPNTPLSPPPTHHQNADLHRHLGRAVPGPGRRQLLELQGVCGQPEGGGQARVGRGAALSGMP